MAEGVRSDPTTVDKRWTAATVGLAVISVILAFAGAYDAGAVVGFLGVLVGGWAMLVSHTIGERFEIVIATVAAAVALAASLAYGSGLTPI